MSAYLDAVMGRWADMYDDNRAEAHEALSWTSAHGADGLLLLLIFELALRVRRLEEELTTTRGTR